MGGGNGCTSFLTNFYKNNINMVGIKKIKLKDLHSKTIAIDAMGFLYRCILRSKKNWRNDIIFLIHKFNKYNIKFVFVFDDNPSNNEKEHIFIKRNCKQEKQEKQEKQKKQKLMNESANNLDNLDSLDNLDNLEESSNLDNLDNLDNVDNLDNMDNLDNSDNLDNMDNLDNSNNSNNSNDGDMKQKVNKLVIKQCEDLCDKLGINRIRIKNKEADEIFKFLIDNNIVDGCYSQDNDLLRRGCKTMYYDLDYKLDTIHVINYDELLINLKLKSENFNDIYDASGTEYNDNLTYCKFKDIYDLINKYGNIENILSNLEEINKGKTSRLIKIPNRFDYLKTREIFNRQLTKKNIQEIMDSVNNFQKNYADAKLNTIEYSKILFDDITKNNTINTIETNKVIRQIKEYYFNTFSIYV
jgi:hypothetical protein